MPQKQQIGEALDALGYRILWVVSYVDTGEVREEYREESEAQERCEALRRRGARRDLLRTIADL